MSAAAVLRSAACRARAALRPTATLRRISLDGNKERPRETIITPRRHYYGGGGGGGGGVNTTKEERRAKELAAAGRISMKLDQATDSFDTHHLLLIQLLQEKIKYDRLKRVLVRVPIFAGIAYCVKQYCSGGSDDKEAKKMTGSH